MRIMVSCVSQHAVTERLKKKKKKKRQISAINRAYFHHSLLYGKFLTLTFGFRIFLSDTEVTFDTEDLSLSDDVSAL